MHMQAIYVKTPKGIEEMTSRKYKLSIKERHVLIMLNGKRTLQEAAATLGPEDSSPVLGRLTAEGFITALSTPAAEPAPSAGAAPAAPASTGVFGWVRRASTPAAGSSPAAAPAPASEQERFEMAGNFMCNTLNAFVGMSCTSLTEQVERAPTLEALRDLYSAWREAIALTPEGRKELPSLENRLAALVS